MRALFPLLLSFGVWGVATAQGEDEAVLRERVQMVGVALAAGDVKTAERLLTPDYRHTDWRGKVGERRNVLQYARHRSKKEMDFRDLQVRIYGEVAMVTGEHRFIDPATRDDFGPQLRFTQFWVKSDGEWRMTASHATRIAN